MCMHRGMLAAGWAGPVAPCTSFHQGAFAVQHTGAAELNSCLPTILRCIGMLAALLGSIPGPIRAWPSTTSRRTVVDAEYDIATGPVIRPRVTESGPGPIVSVSTSSVCTIDCDINTCTRVEQRENSRRLAISFERLLEVASYFSPGPTLKLLPYLV